jgi:hypothetical protein
MDSPGPLAAFAVQSGGRLSRGPGNTCVYATMHNNWQKHLNTDEMQ